jgi:integrase
MPKQGREHAVGPYKHGRKFRIVYFAANGASETVAYETEAQAIAERDAYNAAAGSRTVLEALDMYLAEYAGKGKDTARYRLRAILRVDEGDRPLAALTAPLARELYARRVKEVAPDTHHGELSYVKRFVDWCIQRGYLRLNPFADIKPVGQKRRGKPKLRVNATRRYLLVLLEEKAHELEATAVLTALMLGLRASEVVKRTVEDLDDDGWLLWIRDSKTEHSDREIEVPGVLRERLLKLAAGKQPGEKLFGDLTRHGLHYWTVKFCKLAGVDRVTPHGLRGSGATTAVRLGGGVEQVAAALGHADDGDTLRAHYLGGGAIESARGRQISRLVPLDDASTETHDSGVCISNAKTEKDYIAAKRRAARLPAAEQFQVIDHIIAARRRLTSEGTFYGG